MPELDHSQSGVPSPHVPYQLELRWAVLVGVAVRPLGSGFEGFDVAIIAFQPEVDVGSASVVPSACLIYPVIVHKGHEGLPILHILCYAVHEG